jgi:hypothetical protein
MTNDLRSLARHLGNALAICGLLTLVLAGIIWLTGRDEPGPAHGDAVTILLVLGVTELVVWFALVYWSDVAEERA